MLSSKNIAKSLRGFARLGGDYYRAQTMYEAATTIEKQSDEIAALRAEVERLRAENARLMNMTLTEYMDLQKIIRENAEYKAEIEAGRLIRIPCREFFDGAGDAAWLVWGGEVIEMVHCGAGIGAEGRPFATLVCEDKIFPYRDGDAEHDTEMSDWCTNVKYVPADEYEQTVFTTEEAARAALEGETP